MTYKLFLVCKVFGCMTESLSWIFIAAKDGIRMSSMGKSSSTLLLRMGYSCNVQGCVLEKIAQQFLDHEKSCGSEQNWARAEQALMNF